MLIARPCGSIRSLPGFGARSIGIDLGQLRDPGRKCGLFPLVCYQCRGSAGRIDERF